MIALVWLTLGLTVPASAWTAHATAHSAAQVSVDAHHHHDDDGSISVHEHDGGEAPDGGHDHMPSILLGAVMLPDAGFALVAPNAVQTAFTLPAAQGIVRHDSGAIRRPPRHS